MAWKLQYKALSLHEFKNERWWNYCQSEMTVGIIDMKEYITTDNGSYTISCV